MLSLLLQGFVLAQCLAWAGLAQGHVVLTYPGWRGNNLGHDENSPFGMQWMYPCGGLSVTTNRTQWPLDGGAVAFQPGWFTGHDTALIYINIGLGEQPSNYSWPITTLYLDGPTNNPYPGTVCLPKLTLPEGVRSRIKSGDLASIQVVEAAKHGAGMFTTPTPTRTPSRPPNTMKAVPSPASATKAASHARPCPRLPAILPRRPAAAVDSVRTQRFAPVNGRGVVAAAQANNRVPQHARRNSGSRHWILDAKVNKPTNHRTKIGLWLENVEPSREPTSPTPAHSPLCSSPRCKPSAPGTASPDATQIIRKPGSPRIPLADITTSVLAAETPASFYTHAPDLAGIKPQTPKRSPCPASDLTGAVDMLTPDEAKQLLLLSAQSNPSLAHTIRGIAVTRTPRLSPAQVQQSYLADTFRFDEQQC
ncbi:hypothetical protein C8A01DRAFT_49898 [Parachaetomium inaequale]|uniref:Copper acquisition factor BIM1-like domain-containing protein n=1 Tax=Parachaetomium inaequale TaxID=2588326 RepID=A0AAN6SM76_9PEZI|nr:hypothetical protein C8A01DRAFT_49898 [Parachaetomium inaequale]